MDLYVASARLARKVGFQFIDVKQCHRYLLSEMLGARTRPGRYGGPYEHREEVMLFYHAGAPTSANAPVVSRATPSNPPAVVPHVQPASLTAQPGELPPQPVPVDTQ